MIKVDIITGFLGAGKTTLIKLVADTLYRNGEKIVIIENEFGEIGIDGAALAIEGLNVLEITSGCLCCSVKGDFIDALKKIENEIKPDRILIEPSGIFVPGDIFDIFKDPEIGEKMQINSVTTIIDCLHYLKQRVKYRFFFENQIKHAQSVVMSKTETVSDETMTLIRMEVLKINPSLPLFTKPWSYMTDEEVIQILEYGDGSMLSNTNSTNEIEHDHDHGDGSSFSYTSDNATDNVNDTTNVIAIQNDVFKSQDCESSENLNIDNRCVSEKSKIGTSLPFKKRRPTIFDLPKSSDGAIIKTVKKDNQHEQKGHKSFKSFSVVPNRNFTKESLEVLLKSLGNQEFGSILRAKGFVRKEGGFLEFNYVDKTIDIKDMNHEPLSANVYFIGEDLNKELIESVFKNQLI